ncbi:Mannan endo-1,4-beta-mannosidase F [Termitomyces sp. J132]|nr:hypothetical protein H2248_009473 [Termitomyces sp. 'cryptogamus']KNZ71748.1 Mannan endo-1,4-beta-mannosidase F [Termitomyces sp. J132]
MFCAFWLFLAVLAVSATNPAKTIQSVKRDTVPDSSPFVSVRGNQFFVNGSVFKFVGTNAYWLSALNSEQDIDNTLASIRAANFTVVRTWAFNDVDTVPENNATWFQLISNGTQSINDGPNGLQKLDKVIELAQNHGLYVLLSLTNNWNPIPGVDQPLPGGFNPIQIRQMSGSNTTLPRNFLSDSYGGMDTYVRNFGGPQEHDQFFTNQTLITAFMNYTSQIVTRYTNKTSVFAWEIANDPRCNSTLPNSSGCMTQNVTNWHSLIAMHINRTDPNHVVSTGNQGFFCHSCTKIFPRTIPTPQASPAPGFRRSVPEPQSKAKLLKERKAAWKKQRERQKRAGVQPDGVKIRGRWTASSQTKRQSDLNSLASAFDGSHGVDSADIINIPQIGFGSFQLFPDQYDYSQNPPDPSLPAFNQTLEIGLNWIKLHAEMSNLFNKPVSLTGFGLVTQNNTPFFVPFNSTEAPFGPDSPTPMNITQPFGVTDDQRDDAYKQWVQAAVLNGLQGILQYQWSQGNLTALPGTPISPNSDEIPQSPLPDMTGQSPNDGYGILGQDEPAALQSISVASQGFGPDNA